MPTNPYKETKPSFDIYPIPICYFGKTEKTINERGWPWHSNAPAFNKPTLQSTALIEKPLIS